MGGRSMCPPLSLLAGRYNRRKVLDTYLSNIENYSLLIQSEAARDTVMASNMAALGVEVQGASIR